MKGRTERCGGRRKLVCIPCVRAHHRDVQGSGYKRQNTSILFNTPLLTLLFLFIIFFLNKCGWQDCFLVLEQESFSAFFFSQQCFFFPSYPIFLFIFLPVSLALFFFHFSFTYSSLDYEDRFYKTAFLFPFVPPAYICNCLPSSVLSGRTVSCLEQTGLAANWNCSIADNFHCSLDCCYFQVAETPCL